MVYKPTLIQIIILLFALSSAACSYNPMSDTNHTTGTLAGTGIGGAVGLGTAAAFGVTSKPLLGLATIGGASIGYYISTLRFASAGIVQSGGQVYTLGDYLTIEIPTDQLFDVNSADLLPDGEAALLSATDVLNRLCCQSILVSGNSSGFGSTRFERRLTQNRARVVAAFLWAHGINSFQKASIHTRTLTYTGYGNYFPIASDLSNKGIRANSRIQITAYPTQDQITIDNKKAAFANMGGSDDSTLSTAVEQGPILSSTEVLSEPVVTEATDLKGILSEKNTTTRAASLQSPQSDSFYAENSASNRIEKTFQPTETHPDTSILPLPSQSPQPVRGYKGEAGLAG